MFVLVVLLILFIIVIIVGAIIIYIIEQQRIKIGDTVSYTTSVPALGLFCMSQPGDIMLIGTVCDIKNKMISVRWNSVTSIGVRCDGSDSAKLGQDIDATWYRSSHQEDQQWLDRYLGSCGVAPTYIKENKKDFPDFFTESQLTKF